MKKLMVFFLLIALVLSLAACRSSENPGTESTGSPDKTEPSESSIPSEPTEPSMDTIPGQLGPIVPVSCCIRIPYTGDARSVNYITASEQLPSHEAFDGYDAAFFAQNALVLVTITTGSGSAELTIDGIDYSDQEAFVRISDKHIGESSADMATWLLWIEVAQGLNYTWSIIPTGSENELPPISLS